MAASKRKISGGAETYFAKKLASNEKTVRDKAVKKLRTWISTRCSVSLGLLEDFSTKLIELDYMIYGDYFVVDLTENDMLKLWKGLFYCMWMSDKPKVQEELAETIAQLVHSFQIATAAIDYLNGFYKTICREWHGIDRLRLDKFYLLIRKFVHQGMVFLKNSGWENEIVETYSKMLEDGPLSTSNTSFLVPEGVKTHVIQVYLEELLKCGISQVEQSKIREDIGSFTTRHLWGVPRSALLQLLQPFIRLLASSKNKVITRIVCAEIFDALLKKATDDKQDGSFLKVDFQAMNDQFFAWASRKDILARNRDILYEYIDKFKIITKENNRDAKIPEIQEDGDLEESIRKAKGKCNDSMEESVSICDPLLMDIKENKQSKIVAKKTRKGEKRKKKSDSNIKSSGVGENLKQKKSKKDKISSQECNGMVNGCNVSVEDSVNLCDGSDIKNKHDIPFLSECTEKNKPDKAKGRKRKGDSNGVSEEISPTLNINDESIKKRKRAKTGKNKICKKVQESDAIDKHGKKKQKLEHKFVVVQNKNEVTPLKNEDDVTSKLSTEAGCEKSEIMNNTSDSLDGSYLSTLLKQARDVTSFGGNVNKATKGNGEKSTVRDASTEMNIKSTPRIQLTAESLSQHDLRLSGDTNASEETAEGAKSEDNKIMTESIPLAIFLRHSQKKVKGDTDGRTQKQDKKSDVKNQARPDKKKVRIELSKNTSHTTRDYRQVLRCSPVIPFDGKKQPVQSSLKTPPTSESTAAQHSQKNRLTAADFF